MSPPDGSPSRSPTLLCLLLGLLGLLLSLRGLLVSLSSLLMRLERLLVRHLRLLMRHLCLLVGVKELLMRSLELLVRVRGLVLRQLELLLGLLPLVQARGARVAELVVDALAHGHRAHGALPDGLVVYGRLTALGVPHERPYPVGVHVLGGLVAAEFATEGSSHAFEAHCE